MAIVVSIEIEEIIMQKSLTFFFDEHKNRAALCSLCVMESLYCVTYISGAIKKLGIHEEPANDNF